MQARIRNGTSETAVNIKQMHTLLYKPKKAMGNKGVFIPVIYAVWKSEWVTFFWGQAGEIYYCQVKAMSRILESPKQSSISPL